jgi:hypothetical protein
LFSGEHLNILLLTATINPPAGVPDLQRIDPHIRLNDYLQAFDFYLQALNSCIDAIVFVDNSQAEVSLFQTRATQSGTRKPVEIISYFGLDHPPQSGRGYGEFKMIDYVMRTSSLIQQAPREARIWKITGRYIVRNIEEIVRRAPSTYDIYCNIRNWPNHWMDLHLLSWNAGAYSVLFENVYPRLREDMTRTSPEIQMWGVVQSAPSSLKVIRRYVCQPFIEGIRGSDNRDYAQGMNLSKYYLRSFARRYFPWFWI